MSQCSIGLRGFAAPINEPTRVASQLLAVCPSLDTSCDGLSPTSSGIGIFELRIRKGRVNYRILYFFHGRNLAILGHALTKEDKVPKADIERTIRGKKAFEANPAQHSYSEEG